MGGQRSEGSVQSPSTSLESAKPRPPVQPDTSATFSGTLSIMRGVDTQLEVDAWRMEVDTSVDVSSVRTCLLGS